MPGASLSAVRVAAELGPDGPIARSLPGYEHRRDQIRMAEKVAETFAAGGVLVVEAGTGTGKSLAYLVPAIHWSREHGERSIISTNTINLQEQLIRVDLPFLAAHLGVTFTAALVKGRRNYLCVRKAAEVVASPALVLDVAARDELRSILEWAGETADGSLADLPFVPRSDAWEAVVAEHDDCLRSRCPDYDRCFFYKARREAAAADLLVINHHLLLADLALRSVLPDDFASGVLPPVSRLVIDEAHHLEDVTTDHFGAEVTLGTIERLLGRLEHPRKAERGVLPGLVTKLDSLDRPEDRLTAKGAIRWIEGLRPRLAELAHGATVAFDRLLLEVAAASPRGTAAADNDEVELRVVWEIRESPFWKVVVESVAELTQQIDGFVAEIAPVLERIGMLSPAAAEATLFHATQLEALAGRLLAVALDLRSFVADSADLCRWFSLRRRGGHSPRLALAFAPIEAGPKLRDTLFQSFESVILTSATLSVENRFDYLAERTGLTLLPEGRVATVRFESPFQFADQALIAVPADVPAPDTAGYEQAVHEVVLRTVEASRGGAFVLFTSYGALARAHDALASGLRARRLPVLRQGESGRNLLLERFRRDPASVLFATDSFWEGVDVRGKGLRAVIIARLPFRVPSEPIFVARSEALAERGGDPFADYALPQAVIKLRQGFGRLIRSHDDTGVVVIADSRLARKPYGAVFLNSLPPARLALGPAAGVFAEVEKFFRRR
ncbi:MAG: ATP-dependent DNA helicase [Candidatus Binatia bacterium]